MGLTEQRLSRGLVLLCEHGQHPRHRAPQRRAIGGLHAAELVPRGVSKLELRDQLELVTPHLHRDPKGVRFLRRLLQVGVASSDLLEQRGEVFTLTAPGELGSQDRFRYGARREQTTHGCDDAGYEDG